MNTETKTAAQIIYNSFVMWNLKMPKEVAKQIVEIMEDIDISSDDYIDTKMLCCQNAINSIALAPDGKPYFKGNITKDHSNVIDAYCKQLSVEKQMNQRKIALNNLKNYPMPTMSWEDSLFYMNFYVDNNDISGSTRNILTFFRQVLGIESGNKILLDCATQVGGQGKGALQHAIITAFKQLCSIDIVKEANDFPTRNCITNIYGIYPVVLIPDTRFKDIDNEAVNQIVDGNTFTVKGKYIREYNIDAVAHIFAATNFDSIDNNDRRYLRRSILNIEDAYDRFYVGKYNFENNGTQNAPKILIEAAKAFLIYIAKGYDFKKAENQKVNARTSTNFLAKLRDTLYDLNKYDGNTDKYEYTCIKIAKAMCRNNGNENFMCSKLIKFAKAQKLSRISTRSYATANIDWNIVIKEDIDVINEDFEEKIANQNLDNNWNWFHDLPLIKNKPEEEPNYDFEGLLSDLKIK